MYVKCDQCDGRGFETESGPSKICEDCWGGGAVSVIPPKPVRLEIESTTEHYLRLMEEQTAATEADSERALLEELGRIASRALRAAGKCTT